MYLDCIDVKKLVIVVGAKLSNLIHNVMVLFATGWNSHADATLILILLLSIKSWIEVNQHGVM
jgi:hypothetical protein